MFFVVSTGYSGTTSIAELLRRSPDCVCPHEPEPRLIAEATQYAYGKYPHAQMVDLLRQTRPETVDGKIYGESSNKLSHVIPALHEAFPKAKFVWLIRDARSVLMTHMARGSLHPLKMSNIWQVNFIRADAVGEMSTEQWDGLSRFEKCCWRYDHINRVIDTQLNQLGCDYMFIKLEELDQQQDALFNFLGLRPPQDGLDELPRLNVSKPIYKRPWQSWSAEDRASFVEYCGTAMDKWYPGWRESSPELWTPPGTLVSLSMKAKRGLRQRWQAPYAFYWTEHWGKRAVKALPRRVGRMLKAIS